MRAEPDSKENRRIAVLERSNRNLSSLLRSVPIPLLLLDGDLRIIDFSGALSDIAFLPEGARGAHLDLVGWGMDMVWLPGAVRRVLEGGGEEARTVNAATLSYAMRILQWEGATGPGAAVAFRPLDVTGGLAQQQRLHDALTGIQRLKHQLTTTMQLTRAVIRLSAETAGSLEDYVLHLETRLDSINRVLATLVREPTKTFLLGDLIDGELEAQGAYQTSGARLLRGPEVRLRPRAAQVLCLAIQELVTNAFQHGAVGSDEGGQLHVSWEVLTAAGGERLHLVWSERGREVGPPAREGFGTTVIDDLLAYQLDARTERSFGPQSLQVALTIPIEAISGEAANFLDLL